MTELLQPHEIDTLRQAADKAACNGQPETGRLVHELLDVYEDQEEKDGEHDKEAEKLEKRCETLADALKGARGMLERIRSLSETASEGDALERHGEVRLSAEEAIEDIADALDGK
jgi:hypothetical protein